MKYRITKTIFETFEHIIKLTYVQELDPYININVIRINNQL